MDMIDAERKGRVLRFLYESAIIQDDDAVVSLAGADLRGADFGGRTSAGRTSAGRTSAGRISAGRIDWAHLNWADLGEDFLYAAPRRPARGEPRHGEPERGAPQLGGPRRGLLFTATCGADLSETDLSGARSWARRPDFYRMALFGAHTILGRTRGSQLTRAALLLSRGNLSRATSAERRTTERPLGRRALILYSGGKAGDGQSANGGLGHSAGEQTV